MSAVTHDLPGESRETIRALALLGAFFFAVAIIGYLVTMTGSTAIPRDGTTLVIGRDFLNVWMYGRAAFTPDPSRFYDLAEYHRALDALLGPNYPGQNWSYPPSLFFVAAPFGRLAYLPALLVWTVLGVALFIAVARAHIADRHLRLALPLSPAAVLCVISGQTSLITAATLIASGRWRAFASAAATALARAGATALVFGPQVWVDFIAKGLPTNNLVLADPERIATPFYPTVFMNLRGINLPYGVAMAVQLCFTAFAVAAIAWAYRVRREADPLLLTTLFLACAVSGTPYLLY